jgi:hypothetical protein
MKKERNDKDTKTHNELECKENWNENGNDELTKMKWKSFGPPLETQTKLMGWYKTQTDVESTNADRYAETTNQTDVLKQQNKTNAAKANKLLLNSGTIELHQIHHLKNRQQLYSK